VLALRGQQMDLNITLKNYWCCKLCGRPLY
jgi:hypothetical protein